MSTNELLRGGFITCIYNEDYPFGKCINRYDSLDEAREHIKF